MIEDRKLEGIGLFGLQGQKEQVYKLCFFALGSLCAWPWVWHCGLEGDSAVCLSPQSTPSSSAAQGSS
jgi:hypothetical protein